MADYPVAFFRSVRDTTVTRRVLSWTALAARLGEVHPYPQKMDAPLWSGADYREGSVRGLAGVLAVTLAVLDYDDGTPLEAALEAWQGHAMAIHTSWAHTADHPRYRVVLPLAAPIPVDVWPSCWGSLVASAPGNPDPACKDASRAWFLPAAPPERLAAFQSVLREGEPLTLEPAPLTPTARAPVAPRATHAAPPYRPPVDARERALRRVLATDPIARERAAALLGADLEGAGAQRRADGAACPQCGRPSVWWPVEPVHVGSAMCSHRNSCGWLGSIYDLLHARGMQ